MPQKVAKRKIYIYINFIRKTGLITTTMRRQYKTTINYCNILLATTTSNKRKFIQKEKFTILMTGSLSLSLSSMTTNNVAATIIKKLSIWQLLKAALVIFLFRKLKFSFNRTIFKKFVCLEKIFKKIICL